MIPQSATRTERARDYGPPRLIVELTNVCNLHCDYCLRDEDALYNPQAAFFSVELLTRLMREAHEEAGVRVLMFTGGETTLHPRFGEVLRAVAAEGFKCSFVTNGWHFERVWPALRDSREAVTHVAFSLDGATRPAPTPGSPPPPPPPPPPARRAKRTPARAGKALSSVSCAPSRAAAPRACRSSSSRSYAATRPRSSNNSRSSPRAWARRA